MLVNARCRSGVNVERPAAPVTAPICTPQERVVRSGLARAGSYNLAMADDASAQARGSQMVPREDQRATHEDRDRVVDVLKLAAGDGRLTLEELTSEWGRP